ncbi:uncharacterized protein LOC113503030 isoform X2 [Trichoplusia ni]|uniref:CCR4-NOT transcription complex subunit 10 n=1 Tax=Trichoplusia ni TaxID=7111 RepID=A0A7E5WIV1_TRINI|nr:uncharacterized protein LOC113503030 isoform X2 [Trichoplusia ni]
MANTKDEPVILAHECYVKKDYTGALQHLNELENLIGSSNKRVQHNKAVVEFMISDMKNVDKLKKNVAQLTGLAFAEIDTKDLSSPFLLYNYAVLLYHSRYYYQCTVILERLLASKNVKDNKLFQQIVLLLLEATLCRRTYEKTLEVAKVHGEPLKSNNEHNSNT